jgi:hypothetical protein
MCLRIQFLHFYIHFWPGWLHFAKRSPNCCFLLNIFVKREGIDNTMCVLYFVCRRWYNECTKIIKGCLEAFYCRGPPPPHNFTFFVDTEQLPTKKKKTIKTFVQPIIPTYYVFLFLNLRCL